MCSSDLGLHEVYKFIAHNVFVKKGSTVGCPLGRFLTHFCSHSTSIEDALTCLINSHSLFEALDPSKSIITPVEVEGLIAEVDLGMIEVEDLIPLTSEEFLAIDETAAEISNIFKIDRAELKKITNKFSDVTTNAIMEDGIDSHSQLMESLLLSCDNLKEVYLAALTYGILDNYER